ncbi:MAG: TldD/PmbA family protein [Deltaproteobacteria bacterium]|nr:TldD/PmbA family protein [Deltaproteobacteria bacterium]
MNFKNIIDQIKNEFAAYPKIQFEVFLSHERQTTLEVKEQVLHAFEEADSIGAALRIIQDQRLGFSYTTDLSLSGIQSLVRKTLETAPYATQNPFLDFPEATAFAEVKSVDFDSNLSQVSQKKKLEIACQLEQSALQVDPRVKRVRGASYESSDQEIYLYNSKGLERSHRRTMNVISLMAVAEDANEAESGFDYQFSSFLQDLNPEEIGENAGARALEYLNGRQSPTLKGPVVLDALVMAEILEVLSPSFFADHLVKKTSLFEGQEGKSILSKLIHLKEDAFRRGAYVSCPFDGEGLAKQSIDIVKEGVFLQPFFDLEYAHRLQRNSTASSVREGIKSLPKIGISNFYLEGGNTSLEELFRKMNRGIYITELVGLHTANPISGDFSVGAQGFWVEEGEKKYALKQMAVSGNLKEMLSQALILGQDQRFYFKVGAPSVLFAELQVAGGEKS